jgi:hypothetical protein
MASKKQIKSTMSQLVDGCRDPKTGEVNYTLLAEQTAEELDLYVGNDYEIPEEVFELSATFD